MRRLATTLTVAVLACTGKISAPPEQVGQLTPVDVKTDVPPLQRLPDPETNGGHAGRAPRRITVAQLKQSIAITTGTQWTQIDALASSLGQADFAITSIESTEPNLVFAKFLEDGARQVCLSAATADLTRAPADRVLSAKVPASEIRTGNDFTGLRDATLADNLRYLSLRFWGQPFSDEEVGDWAATFKGVAARAKQVNKPEQAWGAMCVALMTDPRFFTY